MRRSVRLALLVSWDFHIPLFSQIYEGNQNDSVTFSGVSVYHLGPTASAEDSGSSRTKMVFRYQAASWRLLVGARARFRVASRRYSPTEGPCFRLGAWASMVRTKSSCWARRSEEHTSELQSRLHLVCRLLLEKKKERNT